jgi:outer membrane biosynthesis protein TonB
LPIDKHGGHHYFQGMTTAAMLLKEIETMPEEAAAQVLDFAMFIKGKHTSTQPAGAVNLPVPKIKDAYGIFKDLKGKDTTIERDEEDRI